MITKRMQERLDASNSWAFGAGYYIPDQILIVGDRPTNKNKSQKPFIHESGCAVWLSDMLDEHDIDEELLYWINAYNADGEANQDMFLESLRPKFIVALGKNASSWCTSIGIKHYKVPHPQYWKRFKKDEPYVLISLLKTLINKLPSTRRRDCAYCQDYCFNGEVYCSTECHDDDLEENG